MHQGGSIRVCLLRTRYVRCLIPFGEFVSYFLDLLFMFVQLLQSMLVSVVYCPSFACCDDDERVYIVA